MELITVRELFKNTAAYAGKEVEDEIVDYEETE